MNYLIKYGIYIYIGVNKKKKILKNIPIYYEFVTIGINSNNMTF